ncbi:TIGR00725 family protein [Blastochloris viridis]|uniref:ABC-type spermidine/putrescine transport systems, ATPase components n=1 Tax=Blastochloris viridis TaxID=1079 RepID=A0A0H5BPR6_BLAVI|nr:TIGR00725 family protein [Blastochloris viridis]ALK10313.1 DNA recombination-mediator protein A [Blastochloris viridis]BAR99753.1 hypothetical protein BV133_2160 [Blastochloris viridis]CUU42975.1 ABC-type spermidine/putrescine transport systems, ATPase components [Blastochloris viridis]
MTVETTTEAPPSPVLAPEAYLIWHQTRGPQPLQVPIAVIGPREVDPALLALAEEVGALIGRSGLVLICGGRSGVMEAAARGASRAGGLTVGVLPGDDPASANPYIAVPIATGLGEMRNAVIARAAYCLVAIGNSNGTLSEIALGLRFDKPVYGLAGAAEVEGVIQLGGVDDLARALAGLLAAA